MYSGVNPLDTGSTSPLASVSFIDGTISGAILITDSEYSSLLDKFSTCVNNDERLATLEKDKAPYLFTSAHLMALMEITPSVKTRIGFIEKVGPRLTDPRARANEFIGMFRFSEEKQKVEEVLKARTQVLASSLFRSTASGFPGVVEQQSQSQSQQQLQTNGKPVAAPFLGLKRLAGARQKIHQVMKRRTSYTNPAPPPETVSFRGRSYPSSPPTVTDNSINNNGSSNGRDNNSSSSNSSSTTDIDNSSNISKISICRESGVTSCESNSCSSSINSLNSWTSNSSSPRSTPVKSPYARGDGDNAIYASTPLSQSLQEELSWATKSRGKVSNLIAAFSNGLVKRGAHMESECSMTDSVDRDSRGMSTDDAGINMTWHDSSDFGVKSVSTSSTSALATATTATTVTSATTTHLDPHQHPHPHTHPATLHSDDSLAYLFSCFAFFYSVPPSVVTPETPVKVVMEAATHSTRPLSRCY